MGLNVLISCVELNAEHTACMKNIGRWNSTGTVGCSLTAVP